MNRITAVLAASALVASSGLSLAQDVTPDAEPPVVEAPTGQAAGLGAVPPAAAAGVAVAAAVLVAVVASDSDDSTSTTTTTVD
ncbi:MAG: hypothetical protein ACK5M4_12595 [Pseudorhodobacter sp.]